MKNVANYLRVPQAYCAKLGRIAWTPERDALHSEYYSQTLCVAEEIGYLAEGFRDKPLPHFGFLVHLFCLLRTTDAPSLVADPGELTRLRDAFKLAGSPLRNAGAFFAMLLRELPRPVDPPTAHDLWRQVQGRLFLPVPLSDADGDQPPLAPEAFEKLLFDSLEGYSTDELVHWFTNGHGRIAEPLRLLADWLPEVEERSVEDILAALAERDRLRGAVPYIAQFVSALSLPPRRLGQTELPIGGYTDVENRGHPEQILPSQFVLDELEFLRRYAQRELLYYRREEPRSSVREELLVLLDQGVRSWGKVRLILSAVFFALGQLAERRGMELLVASTSAAGVPHLLRDTDEATLARLLEASDFTPDPGLALERVLEEPTDVPRDVVLLTHPRNLVEPDVAAASRRMTAPTRLFAVCVDARGSAQIHEMKGGSPVLLQSLRVSPEVIHTPTSEPKHTGWTGDVEPVPFPFRLPLTRVLPSRSLAFDADGGHVLLVSVQGALHLFETDGTFVEMLPRSEGKLGVLAQIHHVMGVEKGFVLCGAIEQSLFAVHYDLVSRTCTRRHLGAAHSWRRFSSVHYFRDLHTLVFEFGERYVGLDLSTGQRGSLEASGSVSVEAMRINTALGRVTSGERGQGEERLYVFTAPQTPTSRYPPWLIHNRATGELTVTLSATSHYTFTPTEDGQPVYRCDVAIYANVIGDVVNIWRGNHRRFYRLPDGEALGGWDECHNETLTYALDGSVFAKTLQDGAIEIHELAAGLPIRQTFDQGRTPTIPGVDLGEGWMQFRYPESCIFLRWNEGELYVSSITGHRGSFLLDQLQAAGLDRFSRRARNKVVGFTDTGRFLRIAPSSRLLPCYVVVDVFGQVCVFDRGRKLVCMFYGEGDQLAGWLDADTYFGPPQLLGRAETPNARAKIGRALYDSLGVGVTR